MGLRAGDSASLRTWHAVCFFLPETMLQMAAAVRIGGSAEFAAIMNQRQQQSV